MKCCRQKLNRGRGRFPGARWPRRGHDVSGDRIGKVALVGTPNVGKSVIFNALTGTYVTVSNYPGTTVEVSRGKLRLGAHTWEVVDTPGMYSLISITGEEEVTRKLLIEERPEVVVHVVDAKNLERMLNLTLQLLEAGFPVILVVNMMDEASRLGIQVNTEQLGELLGIPVIPASAVNGRGIDALKEAIGSSMAYREKREEAAATVQPFAVSSDLPESDAGCAAAKGTTTGRRLIRYDPVLETALQEMAPCLSDDYQLSKRTVALLLLQDDEGIRRVVCSRDAARYPEIRQFVTAAQSGYEEPLSCVLGLERQAVASRMSRQVMTIRRGSTAGWGEYISRLTTQPLSGILILLLVLYFGLYRFVGVFGAGTLVDYLETGYQTVINPWINRVVAGYVPWVPVRDLLANDYGILTLALRYAIAIVLPIVGTFFIVFSLIEDSGYLPRLALLVDRVFKSVGLSGRAVIPMTLGFGCDTMATMVTRTLETRRERVIATLLLALAIPCSAQLGVVLAILSGRPRALIVWIGFICLVFLLVGFLSARILPGETPAFYMELPPLRWPKWQSVLTKTWLRVQWYFLEVLPIFVLVSFFIWLGYLTGIFQLLLAWLTPVVGWLGLPGETAPVFLLGFFRRDYGAAGLFDLYRMGMMTVTQLVVAAVTLTLFVPCVAQFVMMIKERGAKTAVAIASFVFCFSFLSGYFLNWILTFTGVQL